MKTTHFKMLITLSVLAHFIFITSCGMLTGEKFSYRTKVAPDIDQRSDQKHVSNTANEIHPDALASIEPMLLATRQLETEETLPPAISLHAEKSVSYAPSAKVEKAPVGVKAVSKPQIDPSKGAGKTDGFALAGFIIGLVSLFVPATGALLFGILALVFGAIGLVRITTNGSKGKGFAIVAIAAGLLAMIFGMVMLMHR